VRALCSASGGVVEDDDMIVAFLETYKKYNVQMRVLWIRERWISSSLGAYS
jgi:hypothetical protein